MIDPRAKKDEAGKYIKKKKKRFFQVGSEAGQHVDKHLINRLQNLAMSWRFIASWLLLGVLMVWVLAIQTRSLTTHYTQIIPRSGGTYIEGVIGPLTNMNPIYATTAADQAVSRLIFSGLMRLDEQNQLVGDLASTVQVDDKASIYTITLKDNLRWHDGASLTAQDVVFTVQTIQNPSARSPLRRSLEGVAVEAVDAQTVKFTLPASFSPFPNILTFGILPKHLLEQYSPSQLRSAPFNGSQPIGAGPFKFQRIVNIDGIDLEERELKVQLTANDDYHLGAPRLDNFTFWVAPNAERLSQIFNDGQLSGAVDLSLEQLDTDSLQIKEHVFSQTSGVFLFFRNSSTLLADAALRRALTQSIDVTNILSKFESPVQQLHGPLLHEQIDYTDNEKQLAYDQSSAIQQLDTLGWIQGPDGIRTKDGQRLSFLITTQAGVGYYQQVVESLKDQFKLVGVEIQADYRDLEGFSESVLKEHVYEDMLVYGINIGIDPDIYAYWHSSQADRNSTIRLNLSEYSSDAADEALEAGRSRVEKDIRISKYRDFLSIWKNDAPAIALYRPTFNYYTLENVRGPEGEVLESPAERFRDVHLWTTLTSRQRYYDEQKL